MKQLSVLAPAKINLYLNVAGKRPDGYHDIESVMQTVSLFDRLHITARETSGAKQISITSHGVPVPTDESNLVCRAAAVFAIAAGITDYDISFVLEKNIPTEAGLGGGSADAAAAIIGLNRLYQTNMSVEKLCEIGVKVGADVPFCIRKGTASAEGIGEIMKPVSPMPACTLLIAMPKGGKVSTGEAYRKIDAIGPQADIPFDEFLRTMENGELSEIAAKLYNKFEIVTPTETGSAALAEKMLALGAIGARMSGSGAAVFGIFTSTSDASKAYAALPDDMQKFVCVPISGSEEDLIVS